MARTMKSTRRPNPGRQQAVRGPRKLITKPETTRKVTAPRKKRPVAPPSGEVPEWIGDELQVWDDRRISSIMVGEQVTVQRKGHLEMQPSKRFDIRCTNFYSTVAIVGFPPSRRETKWHIAGRLNAKFIKDDGNPENVRELPRGTLVSFWVEHVAE